MSNYERFILANMNPIRISKGDAFRLVAKGKIRNLPWNRDKNAREEQIYIAFLQKRHWSLLYNRYYIVFTCDSDFDFYRYKFGPMVKVL